VSDSRRLYERLSNLWLAGSACGLKNFYDPQDAFWERTRNTPPRYAHLMSKSFSPGTRGVRWIAVDPSAGNRHGEGAKSSAIQTAALHELSASDNPDACGSQTRCEELLGRIAY